MADTFYRMEFTQTLLDTSEAPKITIVENPTTHKHFLSIQLAIIAETTDGSLTSPAIPGEEYNYRDAKDGLDLGTGRVEVKLVKIDSVKATSIIVVEATIPTKLPGSGGKATKTKTIKNKKKK